MSYNFDKHIYDNKEIHIGKLNMCQYNTTNLYVLDDINESNYNEIIRFILVNKFNSLNVDNVKFIINSKIILFKDLNFQDFKDIEYGYVYRFIL
jgi:hypothetical protein